MTTVFRSAHLAWQVLSLALLQTGKVTARFAPWHLSAAALGLGSAAAAAAAGGGAVNC